MWPFPRKKKSTRRREIRRTRSERSVPWFRRLPRQLFNIPTLVTLGTAVGAALILNSGGPVVDVRVGQVLDRPIPARVALRIEDTQQTTEQRIRVQDASPNYYVLDTSLLKDIQTRLASALTLAKAHPEDGEKLRAEAARNGLVLDDDAIAELQRLATLPDTTDFANEIEAVTKRLRNKPLVDPDSIGQRPSARGAILYDPELSHQRPLVSIDQLRFTSDAEAVRIVEDTAAVVREPLRAAFQASVVSMMREPAKGEEGTPPLRPLYRYDSDRTTAAATAAAEAVEPQYLNYLPGDVLADTGVVTPDERRLLQLENTTFQRELPGAAQERAWLAAVGRSALALFLVFAIAGYMARYQPNVARNTFRRIISLLALLVIFGGTRFAFVELKTPAQLAIGQQALAAALLGIVYPHGAVLAVCGALAVLTTMAVQQGIGFFVVLIGVSGAFVFGVRQVRNRGKIVLVGFLAAGLALAGSVAVGLTQGQPLGFIARLSMWGAGTTLMAAFVIEGVLPGIERLFRLSTGMTLLEWCDASKPLLRMMAAEAPGTYNHSLLVGNLAENAADAIGANGLLCRAGAYYHDIGKINKPGYFVENQVAGISRHERLSPAMSHLIIIGHVKDGIEMAEEYGLPASLRPFIAEHHGTTLVAYFYHAASKARRPDDPAISETEFRYPGPKPQSRETAIVMLCDAVEGAVRAMSEPTPGRIESVVADIIQKRLVDGQFDECDVTFRELAEIERSLVKTLCGIYHARIVYPEREQAKKTGPAA